MIDRTLDFLKTYVTYNDVAPADLPGLLSSVYKAMKSLEDEGGETPQQPVIDWRSTITDDYLVCLEDGRKLKVLKRYLSQTYKMTPEAYRAKWGLPADYPMVAKSYAQQRSEIAKGQGLGKPKAL